MLVGFGIVIVDIRIQGLDLVADPVGYALAAVGAYAASRAGFAPGWGLAATILFALAALFAVPGMLHARPVRPGVEIHPFDGLALADSLAGSAQTAALGATMMALAAFAAAGGAAELARHATWLAWAFAGILALGAFFDAIWALGTLGALWTSALALALFGFAAFVFALVLLWRARALAPPAPAPPPPPLATP